MNIEFRLPYVNQEEPNETLRGLVRRDELGTVIEEETTGVCFSLPENAPVFQDGSYVEFVIPASGGFIEDMHNSVISVKKVNVN
jgi:hypothetical protein